MALGDGVTFDNSLMSNAVIYNIAAESGSDIPPSEKPRLDAPVGITISQGVLSFTPTAGAIGYQILVNMMPVHNIAANIFEFDLAVLGLETGSYAITVIAVGGEDALDSLAGFGVIFTIAPPEDKNKDDKVDLGTNNKVLPNIVKNDVFLYCIIAIAFLSLLALICYMIWNKRSPRKDNAKVT